MSGNFMIRKKPKAPPYDEVIGKYRMSYGERKDGRALFDEEE